MIKESVPAGPFVPAGPSAARCGCRMAGFGWALLARRAAPASTPARRGRKYVDSVYFECSYWEM